MKKILITGASSYIGTNFKKWLANFPNQYLVESMSLRNDSWKEKDFSLYHTVFHVAGIAHIKETKENEDLYYKVNRDLAYETAKKAKHDGVKHFIFVSSMSVYGIDNGVINKNTDLTPKSNYGKSKLQAENLILTLAERNFKISILRPPMIYGKGCKGNYPRLAKLAVKIPIFPKVKNKRSMIYIGNLCEFVRLLIDDCSEGIFFPQNKEYVNTSKMVQLIAQKHKKEVKLSKIFNLLLIIKKVSVVNKVFGNLVYSKDMSKYNRDYQIYSFNESIEKTELKL
ncbi:NAD-dependent epimerase/dehydratase family protein [Lederbergia lenta]|uniref:UDP-glucose 4-epimerase (Galactowaldenases) n=1 Tax=Lederbergia lenta TaxID=1467 RepID=A0A2X4WWH1_LEDLE|nr:NAD-dependent epimerase/dehydratase family protein [Lederbergia lenta]MEC2323156.1 NAD-dependent epimerase/dehydratase family protein [Lederbergia lenta]SQI62832.1 UDP-glucose 4-epimerase (galactowaldenases) [Lederbergia lenta]